MLTRGIRSYHRPTRIDEAQDLAAQGAVLIAGGTRVLTRAAVLPNVVALVGLGLAGVSVEEVRAATGCPLNVPADLKRVAVA